MNYEFFTRVRISNSCYGYQKKKKNENLEKK